MSKLYLSGATLRSISKIVGVPRETVRVRLMEQGIVMRHRGVFRHRHSGVFYHDPIPWLDTDVALLLGLHAGDGWLSKEWGIALNRNDVIMAHTVTQLVRDVLGVEPFTSDKTDRSISIRSGQAQVKRFFLNYGFVIGKKARTVEVPAAVLRSSDLDIARSFLNGLFSADGSFYHRGRNGGCSFSVSSPVLRDGFVELASRLGFEFHRYTNIHRSGRNKVPLNVASIGKRLEVFRWMEEVGSICDSHVKRFEDWKSVIS
jgi:intein/homing endonuclease